MIVASGIPEDYDKLAVIDGEIKELDYQTDSGSLKLEFARIPAWTYNYRLAVLFLIYYRICYLIF